MESLKWILFSFLICFSASEAYKILTLFPIPSKSHGILGDSMIKHLLDAGHEVTYVTPFLKEKTHPNLHQIDVSDNMKILNENTMDIKMLMNGSLDFHDKDLMFEMMHGLAAATVENPNVQALMRSHKFDVVIAEYMFTDLYSSFGPVFQCPLIWFSTIEPHWMILKLVDGPLNPAHSSDYIHVRIAPFTFYERAAELWHLAVALIKDSSSYYNKVEGVYQKAIAPILKEKGIPVPDYNEVRYNGSLILGNSNEVLGDKVPLPQNYKHIGGYHIEETVKPLPEDLQKIMDSNKNGVIYFSLGSNVKSKDLPVDLKQGILDVFGGLKQTVIWKFEEVLPNVPKNVHIVQWAPQPSILAHPNLKLFITHGGLLSLTETIHYGVPVISIPVFADQFQNALRAEAKGFGKSLELTYNLHKYLKPAIEEVVGNQRYAAVAKELSKAYHHRQTKPKDDINFWIEHVVLTRGAPHLRSIALPIPLYQRCFLDLLALILLSFVVIILVVKRVLCSLTSKSNSKVKKN